MKKIIEYEKVDDFAKRVGRSRRTIYRFYAKNVNLREETRIKNGFKMIPVNHKKYWETETLINDNIFLKYENRTMNNLIELLQNGNALSRKLWFLKWTHFITISPRNILSVENCVDRTNLLCEKLMEDYKSKTTFRFFHNSEPNLERGGYHTHLIVDIGNEKMEKAIISYIKKEFGMDIIDVKKYDYKKAALFYIIKSENDINGLSWGLTGNNLKKDGIDYES